MFVLLGGVWADRLLRQLVMLGSDVVRSLAQGATAVLLLTGNATVAELIVLQAVYGTAGAPRSDLGGGSPSTRRRSWPAPRASVSCGSPAAGAWAAISTALGIGSLAGGLLGLRWHPRRPLRASLLTFLAGVPALYVLVAAHAPLPAILVVALIDGSSGTLFNVQWFTALQQTIPPAELSRVGSWDYLGSVAIQPVGQALTGPVAVALGVSTTL